MKQMGERGQMNETIQANRRGKARGAVIRMATSDTGAGRTRSNGRRMVYEDRDQ